MLFDDWSASLLSGPPATWKQSESLHGHSFDTKLLVFSERSTPLFVPRESRTEWNVPGFLPPWEHWSPLTPCLSPNRPDFVAHCSALAKTLSSIDNKMILLVDSAEPGKISPNPNPGLCVMPKLVS